MRRGQALLVGLLIAGLAGCASDKPVRAIAWFERWRPFRGPAAGDVIQVEVSLVERPPGDTFLNQELWALADEQVIPLERKAALEENGFHIGQLGGNTPAGLLTLLTSEQSNVNPRRLFVHTGQPNRIVLGPTATRCSFQIQQDGGPADVSVERAQCAFNMVASLSTDGRTRLRFTPQIRHGEKMLAPRAATDGSGFVLQEEWPTQSYAGLDWDVTLAANQYVVVGARLDRPQTLGYQCFVRREESPPAQRLLVIRTWRMTAPSAAEVLGDSTDEDASPSRTPPLALQAAWTKARGTPP
ncbi:MAG TPA: hypothetical protein VKU02_13015 [Gemmataceae bacterium]|nr:hypothetical protein [Gemmataceae bacterium]